MNDELVKKFDKLKNLFRTWKRVLVAFSGGVDSSVVASIAKNVLSDGAVAVTINSIIFSPEDLENARKVAEAIGLTHVIIDYDVLSNSYVADNSPERCYFCKKELVGKLNEVAREMRVNVVVDGTNADDLRVNRPGLRALTEGGVRSPLAELDVNKNDVRKIAAFLKLPSADRPSMACLATRISYGLALTTERLKRVYLAEKFVKDLTKAYQIRVRDHDGLARIEIGKEERKKLFSADVMDIITERLRDLGFKYVTMDLAGYRSGSMDEILGSVNS